MMKELLAPPNVRSVCDWSPTDLARANSHYYPLSESGPLCPMLDDEQLLYDFFIKGGMRRAIKTFTKRQRWSGKPPVPFSMSDHSLKTLIKSLCNSPEGRNALKNSSQHIALHHAIWAWLGNTNKSLFDIAIRYCAEDSQGRHYIEPQELCRLFNDPAIDDSNYTTLSLQLLGLAFSMLEPDRRYELIAEIVSRWPDSALGLGLAIASDPAKTHCAFKGPTENFELQPRDPMNQASRDSWGPEPPNPGSIADCWASTLSDISGLILSLREASDRFLNDADALGNIDNLDDFSDTGRVAFGLSSLENLRAEIEEGVKALKQIFSQQCAGGDNEECELRRFVRQVQEQSTYTIPTLSVTLASMTDKADALLDKTNAAKSNIAQLQADVQELSRLLKLSEPNLFTPEQTTLPCRIFSITKEYKVAANDLRLKLSIEVSRRKDTLIKETERLTTQYDIHRTPTFRAYIPIYDNLVANIRSADNLAIIDAYQKDLEQVWAECGQLEMSDSHYLANHLMQEPHEFLSFSKLTRSLINHDSSEVAFLLLHIRQHTHPIDEIASEPDTALSLLIDAACEAASSGLDPATVFYVVATAPWLLNIHQSDLESTGISELIVVLLVGVALSGKLENAAEALATFGAADLGRLRLPRRIDEIVRLLVARNTIRVAPIANLARIQEKESKVVEYLAMDGGKYRHIQCTKGHHFARFETIEVFPALSELWHFVSVEIESRRFNSTLHHLKKISVDEWYTKLVRNSEKPVVEHAHFSKKIRDFMGVFLNCLDAYIQEYQSVWDHDCYVISEAELAEQFDAWAGTQEVRTRLVKLIKDNVTRYTADQMSDKTLWRAVIECPTIIRSCPHVVTSVYGQVEPTPDSDMEGTALKDLCEEWSDSELRDTLERSEAWLQLSLINQASQAAEAQEWAARYEKEVSELCARKHEVISLNEQDIIAAFDKCVLDGRLSAARKILDICRDRNADLRAQQKLAVRDFVDDQLKTIAKIKDDATDANMPIDWLDTVCQLAGKVEMQLRYLSRFQDNAELVTSARPRMVKAVETLKFIVKQRTGVFDEVEHYLEIHPRDKGLDAATPNQGENAFERCPELHSLWAVLADTTMCHENDAARSWTQFVKEFAKACNLYYSEQDERKRFAMVTSIKYKFSVYETSFYKPKSEFLKSPLRFYLYRQREVDVPALQRLDVEITGDASAAWLHVVFAPQGNDKIRNYFKYDYGFKNFLLVDDVLFSKILLADRHDVPLRQALHASVKDLATSSPFVAQGYCHQKNNIYVGRTDILQRLLNTPQAMIWGGRRIGKTSVLHALENALRNRGFTVAYVYVDLEDEGDPDLAVARKLAVTLGLPEIDSIKDLERQLSALRCRGSRLAFLFDEVDEYIKKSRVVHRDGFPLATTLRQLVMDNPSKDTVLVYSGYHQLFYEARLDREKRRVGHPFINTTQDVPIRDLTYADVHELVITGFEEMLNIQVGAEVPRLIYKCASGHPAFVQQFCRCLLEWVSKRRSPGTQIRIVADDVDAVYRSHTSRDGGEQPFIFYVNETLGYNLSHLGRAIMLVICDLKTFDGTETAEEQYFHVRTLSAHLNEWCEVLGLPIPEEEHFQQTVELLVMTNMLTQHSKESNLYRVTYPTYVDILRRLDSLGRAALENSLQDYSSKERDKGVLL